MRHRFATAAAAAFALLAGCFPIELDVSPDGSLVISRQEGWFLFNPASGKVRKVRSTRGSEPIFARFSPDGETLLTVAAVPQGDGEFDFVVGPVEGGPTRRLLRTRYPAYAAYSPDGKRIALTHMAPEPHEPGEDEDAGELTLLDPESGELQPLLRRVGALFHWHPSGKSILALRLIEQSPDGYQTADLVRVDVPSGNVTPLARIVAGEVYQLDVAPNGMQALICVYEAGPAGSDVPVADRPRSQLYLVDLPTGALTATGRSADVAVYSPNGKSVVVGQRGADGSAPEDAHLLIGSANLQDLRIATMDAALSDPSSGLPAYPGWIDNQRLFYFSERSVYGNSGKSLMLMTIDADGTGRKCVQPLIDRVAIDSED